MENEQKPPSSQFPSVSNFSVLSPMPNSPQHNKKKNQCYLHNHIGAPTKSHRDTSVSSNQAQLVFQSHNFHSHP